MVSGIQGVYHASDKWLRDRSFEFSDTTPLDATSRPSKRKGPRLRPLSYGQRNSRNFSDSGCSCRSGRSRCARAPR